MYVLQWPLKINHPIIVDMVRIYINVSNINYSGYMNGKNCSSLLPEIFSFLIQTSFANSISNLSISLSLFIKYFFLLLFLHSQDDLFDTIHDNHVKIFSITNSKCNDKFSLNSHSTNSKRDQVFFFWYFWKAGLMPLAIDSFEFNFSIFSLYSRTTTSNTDGVDRTMLSPLFYI